MSNQETNTYELYLISDNGNLKDMLENIDAVTFVARMAKIEPEVDCKTIIVDGKVLPVSQLKELRSLYPTQRIFYRLTNIQSQIIQKNALTTCAAYQVSVLAEDLTDTQLIEEIEIELFKQEFKNNKRVVSFFGTHSGAGVSTTVFNVADLLAKRIEGRVLVLSLNPWDSADYFLKYNGKYLSDIKIDLKTKSLTNEILENAVFKYEAGFYHLAGNKDIKLQRFYSIEEIEYLIDCARSQFEVVLVDGGPHFDNACYAQAFRGSDLRFLVTTQEPKGYQGYWPHIFSQLLEPLGASKMDFMLILNRFSPENTLATEKDISEQLNIALLSTIPDEGLLGSSAITQRQLLNSNGATPEYADSLQTIVRSIIAQYKLKENGNYQEPVKKSFSLFGRKKVSRRG